MLSASPTFPILFIEIVTNYLAFPKDDKGFCTSGDEPCSRFLSLRQSQQPCLRAVLALGIIGFNLGKGHFVHGLYQFLRAGLRFSPIPISGYYTVWTGSFGGHSQTLYPVNLASFSELAFA